MSSEKPEPDVQSDPARVDSRQIGGVEEPDAEDEGSTTGATPDGEYVGRVAGQDAGFEEETGAERRAES
jgi:hypothetical protein